MLSADLSEPDWRYLEQVPDRLVGREAVLAAFEDFLASPTTNLMVVRGEMGIGKSLLLDGYQLICAELSVPFARHNFRGAESYQDILESVLWLSGTPEQDELFVALEAAKEADAPRLRGDGKYSFRSGDSYLSQRADLTEKCLHEFRVASRSETPAVLFIDSLDSAGASTVQWLMFSVVGSMQTENTPVKTVLASREYIPTESLPFQPQHIELGRLSDSDVRAFLSARRVQEIDSGALDAAVQFVGGSPSLLTLVAQGYLAGDIDAVGTT